MRRGFREILKAVGAGTESHSGKFAGLYRKTDFTSIRESVETHERAFNEGKTIKGTFTSDILTKRVAKDVLKENSFLEEAIFTQPPLSSSETGSIKVVISDIADFKEHKQKYEENKDKEVMVCVGGPAAEDQAVIGGIISEIRENLDEIIYMTRDYKESNVDKSAKQSHARHGNALNADRSLTGHALLPMILMRKLLGVTPDMVLEPDYVKIDVGFTIDPKKLRIYFGNELNWLKQEYKRQTGQLTEHDINRLESRLSQRIMRIVEKNSGLEISRSYDDIKEDSAAIHVTFTEENDHEVKHENEEFKRVGIESKELIREEKEFHFGENEEIYSAYKYFGDTSLRFDTHEENKKLAEKHGVKWIDGDQVTRIFVTEEDKKAKFVGIETKDGGFIRASKLHFTGGYKVDYVYDPESKTRFEDAGIRNMLNRIEDAFDLQKPLTSQITTATGVSVNAIFKKSSRLKKVIEKFGSIGEIAVTNSHWTKIADNDDYIVARITGGGNTGSEEYNPTYLLNILANTRRIFGDDLVGILSTYGCPRAINSKNSTEFDRIAEGAIVSYGKGGTGNTKRHAEAAIGLMMLGFEKEVVDYFNQFDGDKEKLLGDEIAEIYEHVKEVGFVHDNIERVSRRMGYDSSLSLEEMIAIGLCIALLSYGVHKGFIKEGKETKEEKWSKEIKEKKERKEEKAR